MPSAFGFVWFLLKVFFVLVFLWVGFNALAVGCMMLIVTPNPNNKPPEITRLTPCNIDPYQVECGLGRPNNDGRENNKIEQQRLNETQQIPYQAPPRFNGLAPRYNGHPPPR